jgi:hypothetical protein
MILIEIFSGRKDFDFISKTSEEYINNIHAFIKESIPEHISQKTKDLILFILAKNSEEMPTF